jgi:dTDP-glucose 4,6-dehydratase
MKESVDDHPIGGCRMNILVTGGAGFIGSHLCEALLGLGHRVTCFDNFLTGDPENVAHLTGNKDFRLIEGDVRSPLEPADYNFIYHLASPASPADYAAMPIETLLINSIGCRNVLDLAVDRGACIFLASTSEIYGDPLVSPQAEDYWGNVNSIGSRSCYDEGKRFAEALAAAYHRHYGTNMVIGRLFNTFGPRMRVDDGRAVPNFIKQAMSGEPITVYGDGSQTRSFCYIDDMIRALILVLQKNANGIKVVNLGNDDEMSVLSTAHQVKEMCGSASEIVFHPLPEDDPMQRRPDLTVAREWLGYEPRVATQAGLEKLIDWFASQSDWGRRAASETV